jgi:hypothetical protein
VLSRREAQRCLANAMFLKLETRKIFVDAGGLDTFVEILKESTTKKRVGDDDFLLARIGFLLTAQKGEVVERLINDDRILEDISKVRPLACFLNSGIAIVRQIERDRCSFFERFCGSGRNAQVSVQLDFPRQNIRRSGIIVLPFSRQPTKDSLVSQLVELLISSRVKVFQAPLTNMIHALLNLPLHPSQSILFPDASPTKIVQHIIDTIDQTVPQDTDSIADTSLDESLSPVFAFLSTIYEIDPLAVKDLMKQRLLPTEEYIPHSPC